jgi:hypothetical protein
VEMVARPLLERLEAVRGEVDLTVLRPPTFDALAQVGKRAADQAMARANAERARRLREEPAQIADQLDVLEA